MAETRFGFDDGTEGSTQIWTTRGWDTASANYPVYDSAAAVHGRLGLRFPASSLDSLGAKSHPTATKVEVVYYVTPGSSPTVETWFGAYLRYDASNMAVNLFANVAGAWRLTTKGTVTRWTSAAFTPGTTYRMCLYVEAGTSSTTGLVRVAYYLGDSTTAIDDQTFSGIDIAGTAAVLTATRWGKINAATISADWYADDLRILTDADATGAFAPWVDVPTPADPAQAVGMVPIAELRMSDLDVPPFDDLTLTEFFGETPATPTGGSAATSTATAPAAGQKATTGSAAATTSATTPSAGHKASQGAATANTAATATAGGIKRPTSGTAATSTTTSTGAGSKLGLGAAHATATATTTGGGARVSAGAGGSAATATATSLGAGHKLTSSGSSATATATTTAAGNKQGVGASGATSTGTTSGAGYTRRSGGTGTTATAAGLGGGRKLTPGGNPAVATAATTGMGVRLTWGGSYAGATASATGGGASTAGWADITITGSIPPRTHTGGAMASRHSGGVGITRHAATIGGTTKTGTIDAPRWAGRIEP